MKSDRTRPAPIAGAEPGGELLNIKQAAAMLNVSEVSLRRWTNAGLLSCVRIGARRERRFRHADLEAYLVREGAAPVPPAGSAAPRDEGIVLEGMPIPTGSHLCSVYRSGQGRLKLAVPFLAEGLAAGDSCFLVAADEQSSLILARLREVIGNVDGAVANGRLTLTPALHGSVDEMLEALEAMLVAALGRGAKRLRVVGDMTWGHAVALDEDDLLALERRIDHEIAPRYPVVALCLYDARHFSGLAVLGALQAHPDTLSHNPARFLG
jgi:transcriptional repressor of dcmA and dcmR